MPVKYNWREVLAKAVHAIKNKKCNPSWRALAEEIGIPRQTLQDGFAREFGLLSNDIYKIGTLNLDEIPIASESNTSNNTPTQETIETREDGPNIKEATAQSSRVRNVEELRKVCGLPDEEWDQIGEAEIGTWEGYRRHEEKDITYDDGKATGYVIDHGDLITVTMYRVRAKFRRKQLVEVFPHIQPVEINLPKIIISKNGKEKLNSKYHSVLFVPDVQMALLRNLRDGTYEPIHDRNAMEVVWKIAEKFEFDIIVILGDWVDMSDFTTHFLREPKFYWTTQPTLVESAWWLARLRQYQRSAKIYFLFGNHEERVDRNTLENLNASYHLRSPFELDLPPAFSVENLLGLRYLEIEWINDYPNGELWISPNLRVVHGNIARSGYGATAKAYLDDTSANIVYGHTHRREILSKRIREHNGERVVTAMCPGALCRMDYVVPGHKLGQEWSQGFGTAYYSDDGYVKLEAHEIVDGRTIFRGREFIGQFDTEKLREDTKHTGWKL